MRKSAIGSARLRSAVFRESRPVLIGRPRSARLARGIAVAVAASLTLSPAAARATTNVPCNTQALISAVEAANAAGEGTLTLAHACTYALSAPGPASSAWGPEGLRITGEVTIHGSGATITRSYFSPPFRLIEVVGSLAIDNVTLSNGLLPAELRSYGGGAIFALPDSDLSVESTTLARNRAPATGGGAISAASMATVSIGNSRFADNFADSSGGGINSNGKLTIDDTTFVRNVSKVNGGAVFSNGFGTADSLTITTSTFSHNLAAGSGGAVGHGGSSAPAAISRSTFNGNHGGGSALQTPSVADYFGGGALHLDSFSGGTVTASTFSGNTAIGSGGAILAKPAYSITGSTIAGNTAIYGGGGGIAGPPSKPPLPPVPGPRLTATIVADNIGEPANCRNVRDGGYNLDTAMTCGFSAVNESVSSTHAGLGQLADNGGPTKTIALTAGSGALDKIPPTASDPVTAASLCQDTADQRGVARPQGAACEIGAFEVVP